MSKSKTAAVANNVDTLADDARELLAATSEVAGEKIAEARQRVSEALERGKEIYDDAQNKVIAGAKAGDKFVRKNPYAAVGLAAGVCVIIGYLLGRRNGD